MGVQDRIERYNRIRMRLDYPYAQRPRANQILEQMLTDEQWLNLRLTNEGESWNLVSADITTTIGQSEYSIDEPISGITQSGKVYFITRTTNEPTLTQVPVAFEDLTNREYRPMRLVAGTIAVPEKIAVYRREMENQQRTLVITPVPQEELTYTIWFYTGEIDRSEALMTKSGLMTELTDFLDLKSTLALLPYACWYDDDDRNERKQTRIAEGLKFQLESFMPVFEDYIDNMTADQSFNLGHWDDCQPNQGRYLR